MGIGGFFAYRLSLKSNAKASDPLHKTDEGFPAEAEDAEKPWLTRYLAYHLPDQRKAAKEHDANLKLVLQRAENKHLMELRRRRYPQYVCCCFEFACLNFRGRSFEQASPNCMPDIPSRSA
jgi:hypothetical protein